MVECMFYFPINELKTRYVQMCPQVSRYNNTILEGTDRVITFPKHGEKWQKENISMEEAKFQAHKNLLRNFEICHIELVCIHICTYLVSFIWNSLHPDFGPYLPLQLVFWSALGFSTLLCPAVNSQCSRSLLAVSSDMAHHSLLSDNACFVWSKDITPPWFWPCLTVLFFAFLF